MGESLEATADMARLCRISLTATAIRYIEQASVRVAVIMSSDGAIDICFMSGELKDFDNIEWPQKSQSLPAGVETDAFNRDPANVTHARRREGETDLRDWFGGHRSIPGVEEVVGLGTYGKTLTILSSHVFADDEDEDEELKNRWDYGFTR